MLVHAGIAQQRAPAASTNRRRGIEPAPRSIVCREHMQAFAVGLQREAAAYAAGRKDGEEGAAFRPLDFDAFSYACGFEFGRRFPKRGGCNVLRTD